MQVSSNSHPYDLSAYHIAAIVPAYNEQKNIAKALLDIPQFVRTIIVVDDCSSDDTAAVVEEIAADNPRVVLLRHKRNEGVGGAVLTGYRHALQVGAQVIVKLDGDGQMAAENLDELLWPLIEGTADYAKGNRFCDFAALSRMPLIRRFGNTMLSFLTKVAVGYWDLFDPCNGYVAIRADVLRKLPFDYISRSFFFETSMLAQLYLLGAVVKDVPMPSRYGDEVSHLSIPKVIVEFLPKLGWCFARRIVFKNFLYDFSMESVLLVTGGPLLAWGVYYGLANWRHYESLDRAAPTGTVVISAMAIILGFQLLLSALSEDLRRVPKAPCCRGPLLANAPAKLGHTGRTQTLAEMDESRDEMRVAEPERI